MFRTLLIILLLAACSSAPRKPSSEDNLPWRRVAGIELAVVDSDLTVVRADPKVTPVDLVNPPDTNGTGVSEVAARLGYSVMINAAMFAEDYSTSIGYMRNGQNVNNAHVSSKLKGFLMFHPKAAGLPVVKIGDQQETASYDTVFQTHRMWSREEGILWKKGASIFHHVGLVGVDAHERILFFYHPDLVDVHDLVARILELGLNLTGLLYLDGGNHGTLYLAPALGRGWSTWNRLPNLLGVKASGP